MVFWGFSGGTSGKKNPPAKAGDAWNKDSVPGLGRSMATYSNILAWKIPWTEDPSRLQSMGSQRVGHEWACMPVCAPTHTHGVLSPRFGMFCFMTISNWYVNKTPGKESHLISILDFP